MDTTALHDWGMPSPVLADRDVHLWYCDLAADIRFPVLESYMSLLDLREQERHLRFAFPADRHRFLLSHAFVRLVLSRYAPVEPERWRFEPGPDGKPFLAPDQASTCPYFNLAHSGNVALLALAAGPVELGVDVELPRASRRLMALARRNFSESEYEALCGLSDEVLAQRFHQLWSLKESFVKARGMGLRLPLGKFSFAPDPATQSLGFSAAAEVEADPLAWSFCSWRLDGGYSAALAIRRNDLAQVRWFGATPRSAWSELAVAPGHCTRRITAN